MTNYNGIPIELQNLLNNSDLYKNLCWSTVQSLTAASATLNQIRKYIEENCNLKNITDFHYEAEFRKAQVPKGGKNEKYCKMKSLVQLFSEKKSGKEQNNFEKAHPLFDYDEVIN